MTSIKQGEIESAPIENKQEEVVKAPIKRRRRKMKTVSLAEVASAPELIDPKAAQARAMEKERIKESKVVRGKFKFDEVPGGSLTFSYRKYKKDGIKSYTFVDGNIYEIPLGVAKHLNQNGKYPVHSLTTDANGKKVEGVGKYVHRFGFHSLDFIDTSDADSVATMSPTVIDSI